MFSPEFLNQICQRAYIRTPRDSWNFDHARDAYKEAPADQTDPRTTRTKATHAEALFPPDP